MKPEMRSGISWLLLISSIIFTNIYREELGNYRFTFISALVLFIVILINLNKLKHTKHKIYVIMLCSINIIFCFFYNYLDNLIFYIIFYVLICLITTPLWFNCNIENNAKHP